MNCIYLIVSGDTGSIFSMFYITRPRMRWLAHADFCHLLVSAECSSLVLLINTQCYCVVCYILPSKYVGSFPTSQWRHKWSEKQWFSVVFKPLWEFFVVLGEILLTKWVHNGVHTMSVWWSSTSAQIRYKIWKSVARAFSICYITWNPSHYI